MSNEKRGDRLTLRVARATKRELEATAAARGVSVGAVVREAIARACKMSDTKVPK